MRPGNAQSKSADELIEFQPPTSITLHRIRGGREFLAGGGQYLRYSGATLGRISLFPGCYSSGKQRNVGGKPLAV